jgi:DNA gyrase inhibitor GyrI
MSRYEEPVYSVLANSDRYEIRYYDSYLVAETTIRGNFDSTGNAAFRRLAGFIFGRNSRGLKMNMTVPVTRQQTEPDRYRYRFVMEKAYSADNLPLPKDDSVSIVNVPGGHYAAARYRGRRNEAQYRRAESALLAALERDAVAIAGSPFSAVYDGPFTPPVMRRNEVLVPIEWQEGAVA